MFDALIPAIIALPLLGFLFTALVGRRLGKRAHLVPVGAIVLAWLIGMWVVFNALSGAEPFGDARPTASRSTRGSRPVQPSRSPPASSSTT